MAWNENRAANGIPEVMFLVGGLLGSWICAFFPGLGIKELVAKVLEGATVKSGASRFGFDFNRAGTVTTVLCAIVRSEDFEFGDGLRIRINVQGSVASVIHVVAAIKLPVVVLGATAVHAVGDVAVDADFGVVWTGLADQAGRRINELGEIASVQHEVIDRLAGDGAGEIRGSGFDLSNGFASHFDCFRDGA